ncbi:hypothetical protein EU803_15525 [Loktanella sp. IMCC34160]|uniref:H-type lectin domain-containing protein n=1 Tax=Loktanella sp. IMCC34160 TaxID=2510646 RepID=UPI00101B7E6B|nr:H-type lectin domain-containing protein [Loktanella sp. IMCC34160]RYG90024.1 hypothetical protein EU803_15525 [Loktanella sp. IMCC34160]
MWSGDCDRSVEVPVTFSRVFSEVPQVTASLSGIDAAHDQNLPINVVPQKISRRGFTINLSTWGETHIARASVSWQAMGPA